MKYFAQLLLILTFFSCAHRMKKEKQAHKKAKISYEQSLINARKKLVKITNEALQSGERASEYLASNLFLKASQASYGGDYESSVLIYEFVLKLSPDNPFVALKYAVDLIRVGRITTSLSLLEKYYKLIDRDQRQLKEKFAMLMAGIYTSFQKTDIARQLYTDVLKHNPSHVEACVFLAKSYAESDKITKALKKLNACEKFDKENAIFSYYKAKIFLENSNMVKAKIEFKKALKKQPTYYQAALGLGLIYEDAGQIQKAINIYKDFLKDWANNRVILSRLVQALLAQESYDDVIEYAQRLVLIDPSDLNLKVKLGIIYTEKGNYKKAIEIFQKVLEAVPDSDKVLYYLGAIFQEIRRFEKSIEYYSKIDEQSALYLDSSIQISQMLSAMALEQRSKEGEFIEFVKRRKNKNDKINVELSVIEGQYFESINKLGRSIASIESVSSLQEFTDSQRYYLAMLHDRNKNYERSIELVEDILKRDPKNAHAWNFLGYSYLEREKDFDKAFKYISKAVELEPEDGYIRDSLGWYYFKTGDLKNSLKELNLAYKLVSDDRIISKHLGEVYMATEQFHLAREFYQKALKLSEKKNDRDEVQKVIQQLDEEVNRRLPASISHPPSSSNP